MWKAKGSTWSIPEETSYLVDSSCFDESTEFGIGFELRRHKHESLANEGSQQCRADWLRYIGPVEKFGSCNPYSGHFGALVLPLCFPERLKIVSYVFEFAFIYDAELESVEQTEFSSHSENAGLDEVDLRTLRSQMGTKQLQSKMLLGLSEIDPVCAKVVIDSWKTMVSTTAKLDKRSTFDNLESYVEYRVVDTGAPFVDTLMRFGFAMVLTGEEEELMQPVCHACFAALGLANDYFSFDVEFARFQESDDKTLTNAVWLFMQWCGVDVARAKQKVKEATNGYEREFERQRDDLARQHPDSYKLKQYLNGLAYQISGNIAWSLTCPRYHPECRYDPNHGANMPDSSICSTFEKRRAELPDRRRLSEDSNVSNGRYSNSSASSSETSLSTTPSIDLGHEQESLHKVVSQSLDISHVSAPFDYISSMPSKGVRDTLIDALNVWIDVSKETSQSVKSIINVLHNASLMLDDIEDSSPLRRSKPSTHMVFGQAQTMNSANYYIVAAIGEAQKVSPACVQILVEGLKDMHTGQSWEIHWTQSGIYPSEEHYLSMVDSKTGGLFRLAERLLASVVPRPTSPRVDLEPLLQLLGRYFQIRDDYQNIADACRLHAAKGILRGP